MIIINNPVTGKRVNLTEPEFNSYMAQTNGDVLNWIISSEEFNKFNPNHDDKGRFSFVTGGKSGGVNLDAPFDTTLTAKDGTKVTVVTKSKIDLGGNKTSYAGILTVDGKEIGDWERQIGPDYVECTGLSLGEWGAKEKSPFAEKGIGTEFHKRTEEIAKELGKENIIVHAVSDGSSVWATEKFGYKFDSSKGAPIFTKLIGLYKPSLSYGKETYMHPFMENTQNRNQVLSILESFKGAPSQWATPSQILSIGKNGPKIRSVDNFRLGVYREFTMGEYMLSKGWNGIKSSEHITKMVNMLKLHIVGIESVNKFNPNHDELGRFSSGSGVGASVAQSILERVKANGGLSVKVVSGNEPTSGYMVAKGTTFGATVSATDFYDPNKGPKILADYAKKHKSDLINGKYYLGLWHNTEDGNVYLDVSENIQNRETAIHEGQPAQRNQISIWDVVNMQEIQTGGSGVTKRGFGSGRITDELIGDDGFGNRRMGENNLEQIKKTRVIYFGAGLRPIFKFNPYHDELGRFTTGSGYAQGGYTAEQTYRQNQMRGKGPTHNALRNMIDNGASNGSSEQTAMFNSFKQIYEVKSKGITTSGIKTTVEIKLNDIRTFAGELKIKGDIIDSNTKQVIGGMVRTFTNGPNGIQVEHDYLAIHHAFRDEYKGFGVGRKVIHNSEAYYANIGLHKITVGTAWDGARTWARAGFDWNPDYKKTNFDSLLRMGIIMGFHNNTSTAPKPIINRYHRLMKAMSPDYLINKVTGQTNAMYLRSNMSGIKYNPMTNKNFPIPNDFATLGYKKGLKNWVGKEMSYDMRMKYEKIVNSEGYNIKTKPPTDRNKDNLLFTDSPRERPVS
jgi:hypothetical protein